ncbi:MAG: hypothetical protein U9Q81_00675, partial [Pseudomonadota bacterium]|nr:hypothetical protein [Pseudomonadota bacterium]
QPFVQQEVRYEVRVYRRSHLLEGDLLPPEISDMVIEAAGQEDPRRVGVGDREYELIRYEYLLFPQRSGPVRLPGAVYSGRQVYARGKDRDLVVRARPAEAGGRFWLPARSLRVSERWSPAEPDWQVGRPVKRGISLEAEGLTAAQLPTILPPEGPDLRIHPAGDRLGNQLSGSVMTGMRETTLVYLPRRAGVLDIPAVHIHWWDTERNRNQVAALPGRRIRVAAGTGSAEGQGAPVPAGLKSKTREPVQANGRWTLSVERWRGLGSVLMAVLAVAALWAALRSTGFRRWLIRRLSLVRFVRSCKRDDARSAWAALRAWAAACPSISFPAGPGSLAGQLPDQAAAELWALDAVLFGRETVRWRGAEAARRVPPVLRRLRRQGRTRASVLPELNP